MGHFTPDSLMAYLDEVFPQASGRFVIEDLGDLSATIRLTVTEADLRPGGTVSGPSIFALADVGAYAATLNCIGRQALAVTTNVSLDFMRKPVADRDLIARAEVLKVGRTLCVTDVRISSLGDDRLVARATLTYSIPPKPAQELG